MAQKKLPIVIDNYVKSECWTQILLSIIQTSKAAPAWIAAHIGIIGTEEMDYNYGNLSKIFSYRNALDILNFEEVSIWNIKPENIVEYLKSEIDADNYMIVELKHESDDKQKYWIHEQLIFGHDDEQQALFGSVLDNKKGKFVEISISYNEMKDLYSNSYEHFKDPQNINDFIYWSRSNFLISRVRLKKDYVPQGCEYDLLQNIVIEADGKEFTSVQYDSNRNILSHKTTYSGIACLIAAEKRIEKLLQDRYFIEKDTDIEYNDLFGQLAKKLAKDLYKLYEHRKMILDSLYWFYSVTKVINPEDSLCIKKYAICCENVAVYYNVAQKFVYTRDWHVLEHLKNIFSAQYKNEHKALNELVLEMKNVWYRSRSFHI